MKAADSELEALVTAVTQTAKYANISPDLVQRIGAREIASRRTTKEAIKEGIHGNICRCTGYNSIIRAVQAVAEGKYKEEK